MNYASINVRKTIEQQKSCNLGPCEASPEMNRCLIIKKQTNKTVLYYPLYVLPVLYYSV